MVDTWTKADLEARIARQERVSKSRYSTVHRLTLNDGSVVASKTFHDPNVRMNTEISGSSYQKPPEFYLRKEGMLLDSLDSTKIFPKLIATMPSELKFIMEWVEGVPFYEEYLKILRGETESSVSTPAGIGKLNTRLLNYLGNFYDATTDFSNSISQGKGDMRKILNYRGEREQDIRLRSALYKLVYWHSPEFKYRFPQFYNVVPDKKLRKGFWRRTKESIRDYVGTKGIDFNKFVEFYLTYKNDILCSGKTQKELFNEGKLCLVHGDWGPHNIISLKWNYGKVLDPNEARMGLPYPDVVSGIHNLWSRPTESRVPSLANEAWNMLGEINRAPENVHDFLIGYLVTRIDEDLRIAGSNTDYSDQEIDRFVCGHPGFEDLSRNEKAYRFKRDRIEDIDKVIWHYEYGGGQIFTKDKSRVSKKKQLKFSQFAKKVEDFLYQTKISMEKAEPHRGKPPEKLGSK